MHASLLPFRGLVTPGIYFSSGYALWLARFSDTPTEHGPFAEVWLITPSGERLLFVDPERAGLTASLFHEPDRAFGARIAWRAADYEALALELFASDGTEISLSLKLGSSIDAWVANGFLRAPGSLRHSASLAPFVAKATRDVAGPKGLCLAGRTELGRLYALEPRRVRLVVDAKAQLDGRDLGRPAPPPRPIRFGDWGVPERALVFFGDLYREYTAWGSAKRVIG
ncbi:MAG: hypothetical protein ACYC3S_07500 [Chloroflexota bacterium]